MDGNFKWSCARPKIIENAIEFVAETKWKALDVSRN